MPSKFPIDKKYCVYYFIDEIMRGVFGCIYDKLCTENSIDYFKRVISDFKKIFGIKIKLIITDNDY